ncbi:ATP synthase F(0) complex subunit j, mitochondrial isoform X1 [Phalacrocorax aristotelis]|uniref:ATP synthase F(0) complex subunit j, mitochondrial isoform X1 n=2 Tax=Phalacrocorax aristotelis TaxID=126867 RepID=UPI003F4C8833
MPGTRRRRMLPPSPAVGGAARRQRRSGVVPCAPSFLSQHPPRRWRSPFPTPGDLRWRLRALTMVQNMLPKSLRAMKFYFATVYQEIWAGVALTAYVYYKISYGGKKAVADKSSGAGHH